MDILRSGGYNQRAIHTINTKQSNDDIASIVSMADRSCQFSLQNGQPYFDSGTEGMLRESDLGDTVNLLQIRPNHYSVE